MPNHVTNRIIFNGPVDDVAELKKLLIVKDDPAVDFNILTPMPEILGRVVAPVRKGDNGRTMVYDQPPEGLSRLTSREATEEEQAELDSLSHQDWYSWSIDNWGTKWNGYDFNLIEDHATYEFTFNTAWSPPHPILDELSIRFPEVTMDVAWFDENYLHAGNGTMGYTAQTNRSEDLYTNPTDEMYEKVYGVEPPFDYFEYALSDEGIRQLTNSRVEDVEASIDDNGFFDLTSEWSSTDQELTDDEMDEALWDGYSSAIIKLW